MPPAAAARSALRDTSHVVLLAVAHWAAAWIGRGLLEPGAALLQKPFDSDTIVRIVHERLESASLPPMPPTHSPPPARDSQDHA
jgi:hypothetical protein